MKIDMTDMRQRELHHIMTSVVVPRPIAWVSTIGADGIYNLATFSAYCVVCIKPPMVGFHIGTNRDNQEKDTHRNIMATKDFVLNVVTEDLAKAMNITSTPYPPEIDEFKEAGLTAVKADLVKAPMVAESPINLECRLYQMLEFGEEKATSSFAVGQILKIHIKDEVWVNDAIDMAKLKAIGRLGGGVGSDMYCRTSASFIMGRPT